MKTELACDAIDTWVVVPYRKSIKIALVFVLKTERNISRHGSYDLPPIPSSSFLWKPGNDLKMELRSFLGRSFKNTCKIGGFRFNLRHVSSMASMTSHIGRKVFGPEEHPMSAIVMHSGKLLLYSCTMVSCSMGLPLTSPSSVEKTRKQILMPLVLFLQNK